MPVRLHLLRHAHNDADYLTDEGIEAALDVGRRLDAEYDFGVTSGVNRSTQTLANLQVGGVRILRGVVCEPLLGTPETDRVSAIFRESRPRTVEEFLRIDPEIGNVMAERSLTACRRIARHLSGEGTALVVGHSPMIELCFWRTTGTALPLLERCAGLTIEIESGRTAQGG